ncbi:PHD finger domain-containing protein [Moelleriella libera RCEF 2490]|uniref:PHD finger domain-containing protein n=1 Tax=Moelleriella libera RCEF 2490 TaxID=1081109 RepID=A0A168B6A9_9HYPO|nr:PHD finger domain-containing protein [Moelleriella libera RCEF 2490]
MQRIEPYGWDRYDRTYFVLDDNRIYRLVAPPTHVEQRKATKLRRTQKNRRSSKRLRPTASQKLLDKESSNQGKVTSEGDDGLGRATWECVAVSLSEAHAFLNTLDNTQDENEKILRKQLERYLVPILVKQEEAMRRRELQREREALNLAMMANAKRSSRIANKVERQQRDEEAQEKKRQQAEAELAVQRDRAAQAKAEQERNLRMLSRQRRLQEREARRLQHEEELSHLSGGHLTNAEAKRTSQRRQQADIQRKRQVLQDIASEEDSWIFDCSCGLYGQIDDGNHSVACDRCNVWQHSRCLGIQEEQAEQSEFHFICLSCRRQDQERADDPKMFVRLKVRPSQLAPEASPNEVAGADADNEEVEIRADPSVQDHTLP